MNKELMTSQEPSASWNGYSLDELRYQRAVTLTRIEIQKGKILQHVQSSGIDGTFTAKGFTGVIMKKFFGNMSFIDYIFIGFKVAKTAMKFIQILRNKKFF
jgi:hypothetical protein